jgi:hypothetical protein
MSRKKICFNIFFSPVETSGWHNLAGCNCFIFLKMSPGVPFCSFVGEGWLQGNIVPFPVNGVLKRPCLGFEQGICRL